MAEPIAWAIYVIGFGAVVTSEIEGLNIRQPARLFAAMILVAMLWPLCALIVIGHRIAGLPRNG